MPIQSGDSRYHHRLWHTDPEAHAPMLMAPTTDLLASRLPGSDGGAGGGAGAGGSGDGGRSSQHGLDADGPAGAGTGSRGAAPTDPLFPSLLIPPNTALGTLQMAPHPATAAALNHRLAWDRRPGAIGGGPSSSVLGGGALDEHGSSAAAFNTFLASKSRAVFRALNAPGRFNGPALAGGIVGAQPMFSSVKQACPVLVGMGKNTSSAALASSGLRDAMFVRGRWVETGMPSTVQGSG